MPRIDNQIDKFRALSLQEVGFLLFSTLYLPIIRLLLYLFGYNKTRSILSFFIPDGQNLDGPDNSKINKARMIAYMVGAAAQYGLYHAKCLEKSLLLWWLLARCSIASEIRFGVKVNPKDSFFAHAWVECNNLVLNDSLVFHQQVSAFE